MSAIFGIINKNGQPVEETLIVSIRNAIAHRATDGQTISEHRNATFGHCRLYVHPQQRYELQPFCSDNFVISADARIDNRTNLSKKLDLDSQKLAETSDDKLILMAYRKWGRKCVDYLEGEFAFAIWNVESRELFAATDHIGFRPFFYYDSPEMFIFCSEIKGVVAAKPLPNYFEEESLIDYFYRNGTPGKTYNKEVFALCGGNSLALKDGKFFIQKYWTLEATGNYHFKKNEEWYDCTRELVYKAIEKRLNPKEPTGITLSGGLDSTSITCILSELLLKKNKPLYAFSSVLPIDYKGIEKDERHYIEIVGKHCPNIIQSYVEAPGVGPFSDLVEAFEIEETFPNCFFYMEKAIYTEAKSKNIRNLYSGFGGDFWISNKGNSVIYFLLKKGAWLEAFRLMAQLSMKEKRSIFYELRVRGLSHTNLYQRLRKLRRHDDEINWQNKTLLKNEFINRSAKDLIKENYKTNFSRMKDFVDSGMCSRLMNNYYNKNSWFEFDSSVPFFDKNIMEFLALVPERLFIEGGVPRNLIRESMKSVIPTEICLRTDKTPFSPGFPNRLLAQKIIIEQRIAKQNKDKILEHYFERDFTKYLDEVHPFEGFGRSDKIVDLRISQASISCLTLDHLSASGYLL